MTELLIGIAAIAIALLCYAVIRRSLKRAEKLAPLLGVVSPKEDAYGPLSNKKKEVK
jgi:hypothetical protein